MAGEGGARVVATQDDLLRRVAAGTLPACATALVDNAVRLRCLEPPGDAPLPALVHPSAVVSPSAPIGRGTVVMPRAVANAWCAPYPRAPSWPAILLQSIDLHRDRY